MADLTQSSASTATTTPDWYTNHLQSLATQGANATGNLVSGGNLTGAAATAWSPNSMQNSAWDMANSGNSAGGIGNYKPSLANAGVDYANAGNIDVSAAGNPYLQAGTSTSGISQANPYLASGTATSGLSQANPYLQSGTSSSADLVNGYMNPYTQNVVNQIGTANQQNIAQNLSPGITSGAVGSGQFGSQRGANALALGLSNANIGALGQQSAALQSGYSQALAAAQAQRQQQTQAGQIAGTLQNQQNQNLVNAGQVAGTLQNQGNQNQVTAGQIASNAAYQNAANQIAAGTGNLNLGIQSQQSGLSDINALATMGAQRQAVLQNQALAPYDIAAKQASLMSGANIPTTVSQTMNVSPLSAIAGLASTGAGLFTKGGSDGTTPLENIISGSKDLYNKYFGQTP